MTDQRKNQKRWEKYWIRAIRRQGKGLSLFKRIKDVLFPRWLEMETQDGKKFKFKNPQIISIGNTNVQIPSEIEISIKYDFFDKGD